MADLVLGNSPDKLTVNLVSGDPVSFSLTLKSGGVPTPWPAPPELEFGMGATWVATLNSDETTATWDEDQAAVNAVMASSNKVVRLAVDGLTWWVGVWVKRA